MPPPDDEDDRNLFRKAIGEIRLLSSRHLYLASKPKPKPVPRARSITPADLDSAASAPETLSMADSVSFVSPGMQKSVLKKLRRGYFEVEAELDLHGLTAREASQELARFLHFCVADKIQCVHIIHGKGFRSSDNKPILKNKTNQWLRQHPDVLAFCSAPAAEGGTGALYVLLRRSG